MSSSKLDVYSYLKQVFLFKDLDEESLEAISKRCTVLRHSKKTLLFDQGDLVDSFYILVFGKAVIFRASPKGDEQILHVHNDGDLIAEAAMFSTQTFPASCRIEKDALFIRVPAEEFRNQIVSSPELAITLLSAYSKRLREFAAMIESLSLDDISERLFNYLKDNSSKVGEEVVYEFKMAKKELANMLGITPETLSRTLKILKTKGMIAPEKSRIVLKY